MKDPDYLIKVEKAIQEKYGDEAIQNPKETWNQDKENKYLDQKHGKKANQRELQNQKRIDNDENPHIY